MKTTEIVLKKPKQRKSIGPTRSPETRRAIVEAAREILTSEGYGGFTLDAVAKRAGASKPTIYKWWQGKPGLLIEIYDQESEALLTTPDLGSLADELVWLIRTLWRFWRITACGAALRSLIAEAQHDGAALALVKDRLLPQRRSYPLSVFERAKARGELDADFDPTDATDLLTAFSWYHLVTDTLDREKDIEPAVAMIAAGLRGA